MDREDAFRREHDGMHDPESPAMYPANFYDPITDNSELDAVIDYWRARDRRIELITPGT